MKNIIYSANAEDKLRGMDRLLKLMKFDKIINSEEKVLIKPNMCAPLKTSSGGITKPLLVVHLAERIKELGGIPTIAESAIGVGLTEKAFILSGLKEMCKIKNIRLVNIEEYPFTRIKGFEVSSIVKEVDKFINFPVMKTHKIGLLIASLSLKNLMGLFSSRQKTRLHINGIEKSIGDINEIITPDLNIMDATICMEGQAPTRGDKREVGMLFASKDRVSLDLFCCRFMGIPIPEYIKIILRNDKPLYNIEGDEIPKIKPFKQAKSDIIHKYFDKQKGKVLSLPIFRQLWIKFFQFISGGTGATAVFPEVNKKLCKQCGMCASMCPKKAITLKPFPVIDKTKCARCFGCAEICPSNALSD